MYLVNYQAFNNTQIKNKDAVTIPPLNHIGPHLCLVDILLYYILPSMFIPINICIHMFYTKKYAVATAK